MFLIAFPLLLVPFVLYNMAVFLLDLPPSHEIATIPLPSDRSMSISLGDALVALAMFLLYLEVLKAARFASKGAHGPRARVPAGRRHGRRTGIGTAGADVHVPAADRAGVRRSADRHFGRVARRTATSASKMATGLWNEAGADRDAAGAQPPVSALKPAPSMPAMAQASSLSEVSPDTPTAPTSAPD